MTKQKDSPSLSSSYAKQFDSDSRAIKHQNKFTRALEQLRHLVEVDLVKPMIRGKCFDCSVGFGRWIPPLDNIDSYTAMDASTAFVKMVSEKFPQVRVYQSDIRDPLKEDDNTYDTVMSIRTLPPIEGIPEILAEMVRIAKPNGHIVFDYGKKSATTSVDQTTELTSSYDIPKIIETLPVKLVKRIPIDSFFVRAIKNSAFLSRAFSSRFNFLPMSFYVFVEKICIKAHHHRVFYVLEKHAD